MQTETPRQRAGRENQKKSKGLTEFGRQALREAAYRTRPWERSTGPRTVEGKARSSRNAVATGHRRALMLIDAHLDSIRRKSKLLSDDEIAQQIRRSIAQTTGRIPLW